MPVFSAVLDPQLYEADIKHCTPDLLRSPVLTLAALEGRTGSLRRWCVGESGGLWTPGHWLLCPILGLGWSVQLAYAQLVFFHDMCEPVGRWQRADLA